jgi:hypothetical protein
MISKILPGQDYIISVNDSMINFNNSSTIFVPGCWFLVILGWYPCLILGSKTGTVTGYGLNP